MQNCFSLIKCFPAVFIVVLLFASCGQSREEVARPLVQAEAVLEQHPDSALVYLSAIRNPSGLPQEQRHNYHLLRIQAKDKTGQDICADTIILQVKDYYLQKKDFPKATLAAFYCGRVWSERKDATQALQAYLEAESTAEHISDTKRKGLIQHNIGWIYYTGRTNYKEAIVRFKQAAEYFRAGNYAAYSMAPLNLLGTCFLIQEQADSALFYQQQALDIAISNRDTTAWAETLQNISVTYRETGDNLNAKTYALQAIQLHSTVEQKISAILNLATIYYNLNQNDSAAFYARRVEQMYVQDSLPVPASLYELMAKIAKRSRQFEQALTYQEKYTQRIFEMHEEEKENSIAGIQEKYNLELVKIENQKLLIQRLWIFIIAPLSILFLTAGGFFLLYRKNSRQKIKLLQTERERDKLLQIEQEQEIKLLQTERERDKLLQIKQEQEIKLLQTERERNKLHSSHTDFYKKAAYLKNILQIIVGNDELSEKIYHKISRIFYDADELHTWDGLYPTINRQYNELFDRMRQQFPQLGDVEFKICCLEYAGFSNKEMAGYVQLKLNTVQAKKSTIRKTLGIPPKGKIKEFLAGKLDK